MDIKMKTSDNGLIFLEEVEGKDNHVYPDSGGEPTIGIGHLLTKSERASGKIIIRNELGVTQVKYSQGLSDGQVYDLLRMDVAIAEKKINRNVVSGMFKNVYLEQFQFDTLVSFTFNVGVTAFCQSTLLKRINGGDFKDVPYQLRRWVYDNGKKIRGLVKRREAEVALWKNLWRITY